jgi:hypothetical protein
MKTLGLLAAIGVALWLGMMFAFPTYTHRFRLTIEIDTPEGVRSGSSVIEVSRKDVRWVLIAQGQYEFRVRGEAVFVDLGDRRNVVALLAHGPNAENVDQMISLPIEAHGYDKWDEKAWSGKVTVRGPVELKPPLIPTLVTFADPADPRSARVIYATLVQEARSGSAAARGEPGIAVDRFGEMFGSGVRLKRAWIETTDESITSGIEHHLPWLLHVERYRTDPTNPFTNTLIFARTRFKRDL